VPRQAREDHLESQSAVLERVGRCGARCSRRFSGLSLASGDPGQTSPPNRKFLPITNVEGMHSYFWLVSPRPKTSVGDDIPYTDQALRQDLLRVRNAWDESQGSRERDAIYGYLTAVFELVAWWTAENRALERAQKALRLRSIILTDHGEPFAAIIRCTADPAKVDKRTRSKWSRALRYVLAHKSPSEGLDQFMKRKGGINSCAAKFASL
jgi:hypothetical protein